MATKMKKVAKKKMKIKKGDTVVVLTGRDRGREGEVLKAMPKDSRVLVNGVNMVRRHQRPSPQDPGGIVDKEMPIHVSNVAVVDPKERMATRVGYKVLEDGRKVRVARRSGEIIDT
jgi:large subunit ribosomal protein L24